MVVGCVPGTLDPHKDVPILLDDGNLVWDPRHKEAFREIIRMQFRTVETGAVWHIASRTNVACGVLIIGEGGIADMVGMHVVEIHPHGGDPAQLAPFRNIFCIGCFSASGCLDVEDIHAFGLIIEAGVFVFNFQVTFEDIMGPEHHVVGIVAEFRAGGEGHALRSCSDFSNFSVKEPVILPVPCAWIR